MDLYALPRNFEEIAVDDDTYIHETSCETSWGLLGTLHCNFCVYIYKSPLCRDSTGPCKAELSSFHGNGGRMYTGHHDKVVLPRKRRKNFVPKTCDCSSFDGLMYARPVPLRDDEATDEVASFKTTLCVRMDRQDRRTGLFMFLVPYPWNRRSDDEEAIEVGLDNACTETMMDDPSSSLGGRDPVVCAHVHYDSADELLKANVRAGDRSCICWRKIERARMPKEAAVGFASRIAGDPIKLENILTWSFHSTLESKDPPRSLLPRDAPGGGATARGEQRLRFDPWNRNVRGIEYTVSAELAPTEMQHQRDSRLWK